MSRLGRTAFVHFVAQSVMSAAGFAGTFAIARLLGPGPLGSYTVALALAMLWFTLPVNAICSALTKRVSEQTSPGEYLGAAVTWNTGFIVFVGATVYVAGTFLPAIVDPDANEFVRILTSHTELVVLLFVSSVVYKTITSTLNGEKRVGEMGVLSAVERVSRVILQIGLVVAGYAIGGLIFATAVTLLLTALAGAALVNTSLRLPTWDHVTSIKDYAKYAWLGTLKSRAFGWMDTIVMSFFIGSTLIGIYEAAWGIASLLGVVSLSVRTTLFPEISELQSKQDTSAVKHLLEEGIVYNGIFAIPGLVGACIIGPRILRIYGPEFPQGSTILVLLVGAYTINVYGDQFSSTLGAVDRPDIGFRLNAVFVVSNLVLNLALVPLFGWFGAAIATLTSAVVWVVAGYWAIRAVVGTFEIPWRSLLAQVLAALGMGGTVAIAESFVSPGVWVTVELVGFGAVTYTAFLIALSRRARDKARMLLGELVP
ncbi:lipid II flippase MurJ [Halobellus captivus]|uniref:lipid II flippase MurJ n=1 Tax=Halobellus captivus TaxID=2592614 RepID=UPI0011A1B4B3|nr:polysaccharide biosynthesis C-terminal domain-containing protein [Halobellus captivus]